MMKLLFRLKNSSIFMKMMAAFMTVLLPLIAITWLINHKGAESIQMEISRSTMNTTRFYLDSLEKEAERIVRYLPNYVMDGDLLELAATGSDMTDYERAQKILAIQQRLDLMKNSSPFIREARAYIPLLQRTILSLQYETAVDEPEYKAMQLSAKKDDEPFIYWQNRLFISMQYPANSFKEPLYAVSVEMSLAKIKEALDQIAGSLGGTSVLLNLDRGWDIQSNGNSELLEQIKAFAREKRRAGMDEGYEMVRHGSESYLTVYKYSPLWNSYSITSIPASTILGPLQTYRQWFWWACALAICVGLFFSYSLFKLIYRPLMRLIHSFKRVQRFNLQPIPIDRGPDEFGYLYQAFNDTIQSLKTLIEQNYEQQIRNQRSELKRLQSQINPHFLYNCFFVLCRLIKSEHKEKAYQFCLYIGEYFQFITKDDEDEIPLELEVKHSRTYVDMQSICYGDRIRVWFEVETPHIFVPRLILQPIIENAYKHALGNMLSAGELWVHSEQKAEGYVIIVEDNGNSISDEDLERLRSRLRHSAEHIDETTGLINVHRRIQLRYGTDHGIEVARSELGGLSVHIHLGMK